MPNILDGMQITAEEEQNISNKTEVDLNVDVLNKP